MNFFPQLNPTNINNLNKNGGIMTTPYSQGMNVNSDFAQASSLFALMGESFLWGSNRWGSKEVKVRK